MAGSIIRGVDAVAPPAAKAPKTRSDRDTHSAGGIVRLGLGVNGGIDSVGGILRFDLGARKS